MHPLPVLPPHPFLVLPAMLSLVFPVWQTQLLPIRHKRPVRCTAQRHGRPAPAALPGEPLAVD
jgi:hypothetical protein